MEGWAYRKRLRRAPELLGLSTARYLFKTEQLNYLYAAYLPISIVLLDLVYAHHLNG